MDRPIKKAKRGLKLKNLKRKKTKKGATLIGGQSSTSVGINASTIVHILAKQLCPSDRSYKFVHALSYLRSAPREELLILVELQCSLFELLAGTFDFWPKGKKAAEMIAAFPLRIVETIRTPMNGEAGKTVLASLQQTRAQMPDPSRCFIFSGNVIRYYFEVVTFTRKPMCTLLNQSKYNQVQLGGGIASVIPLFERMSVLAWEKHGGTDLLSLRAVNHEVSYLKRTCQSRTTKKLHCDAKLTTSRVSTGQKVKSTSIVPVDFQAAVVVPQPTAFKGVPISSIKQKGSEDEQGFFQFGGEGKQSGFDGFGEEDFMFQELLGGWA